MSFSRRILVVFCGSLIFCLAGCGPTAAKVSGTVACQDKPVVWGTVNLQSADGKPYQGQIAPDGKFTIEAVPYGTYTVMIASPDPSPPKASPVKRKITRPDAESGRKEMEELRSKWFPLEEKFSSFEKSGLSLTVDQPLVVFDIPVMKAEAPAAPETPDSK